MSHSFVIVLSILAVIALVALGTYIYSEKSEPAERIPSPGDLKAIYVDAFNSYTYLTTSGREVFFPPAQNGRAVYEITVEGLLFKATGEFCDLFHRTGRSGNFDRGVDWLRVNGSSLSRVTYESVASDRFEHRYTFRIDQPHEQRLTLALEQSEDWSGTLKATVTLMPVGTPGIAERRAKEQSQRQAKVEEEQISAQFGEQITALCVRSEAFRNWADPAYRRKFAEVHADDLIRKQSEIREEATTFLSQGKVVRYLRRHHPEVVERYLGRLESLLLAEQLLVDKRLPDMPKQPTAPKRRLTVEQVRALKVRKQQVAIGDRVALLFDKVEARLNIRERLDAMDLDVDERDMLERELIAEIEEGDDDHANARTL